MSRYIDLTCERLQDGLFEEPLNALSNLGFIIAAFFLLKFIRSHKKQPLSAYFLIFLCAAIGVGSAIFHTTARMWAAMYFDILPIALFAICFMFLFTRHILRLKILTAFLLLAILFFENAIFKGYVGRAPDGYVSLIPTAFFLMLISTYMLFTRNRSARVFCIATVIAVVAITFRATDMYFCAVFPYGTHFLWHSLMSVFIYITVRELIIRHRHHEQIKLL